MRSEGFVKALEGRVPALTGENINIKSVNKLLVKSNSDLEKNLSGGCIGMGTYSAKLSHSEKIF